MPIGVVSDADFEKELSRSSDIGRLDEISAFIQQKTKIGRREGDVETPEALRKIIGETAVLEGRQEALDLANRFNVSPSSVAAYSNGATSTASYNKPNKDLASHINRRKLKVANSATNILRKALTHITEDKLEGANIKTISGVARDLAGIVKDMSPSKENDNNEVNGGQPFVIYAPTFVQENKFSAVRVEE